MRSFAHYISKHLISFATFILILLFLNAVVFGLTFQKVVTEDYGTSSPHPMLEMTAAAATPERLSDDAAQKLRQNHIWAIYLNADGQCYWSVDLPDEVPKSYTIQDVALFSKGYIEDYPVFVKAGAIIPESINIKEEIPTTLEVLVYPLSDGEYSLYEDDGFSNNYKNGLYMITKFNYHYEEDNYTCKISKENGRNLVSTRSYLIRFKNIKNITKVTINDKNIKYNYYYDKDDFIVEVKNLLIGRNLEINIKGKDSLVSSVSLVNEEIKEILYDINITTKLKEQIDKVLFSDIDVRKKRIAIRKLKRKGLDSKYIKIFINLLEYIQKI